MRRKIIIAIVLILIFSFAAGIIYLNNAFLPVKVKGRLASTLAEYLNYNVEIEALKFSPIRGFVIQDIIVYDNIKDKEHTILAIKEASFHVLFLPLIKQGKVILPVIYIDSPYINVRYQQDNTFNFSKIFIPKPKPKKPQTKPKIKFSFFIYKINIRDAKGTFTDERFTTEFSKTIKDLNITLGISHLAKVAFFADGKILADKDAITSLALRGDYNFLSKELNSQIKLGNMVITEFNPYLKALPFSIAAGTIDNGTALDIKYKDNAINLKGAVPIKGLTIRKNDFTIIGDINIEPDITYAVDKKTLDYKTNIKFAQANLTGLKYVGKINNISGDIGLVKNKIWTDNLKLQVIDSNFALKGVFENFSNPYLKFNIKSEQINLEKITSLLPSMPQGLSLTGQATADINIEGNLARLPLDIKATLLVNTAKLQAPFLKEPLNNIKGKFDLTENTASWADISFDYLNKPYASTGKLSDFKTPQIVFGLNSQGFDLKSDIKIKDKGVRIITFLGKYLNSKFDLEGSIDTQEKDGPIMDLMVNQLSLNPDDVFSLLPPALSEKLKKIKLEGTLNINGTLAGKIKNYKDWNFSLKGTSDAFSIYNLKLGGFAFLLEEKNAVVSLSRFTASPYSGSITLNSSVNLNPEIPVYFLKLNCSGVDLAKLKIDTGIKDKDISGLLNINADLNGNIKDPASLKGTGLVSIKDGKLWELNLLKGMGQLFLISDFEKIIFKDALGEFTIADKTISTENLKLTSEQLNVDCVGRLGFDGTLDFTLYTQANKNLIQDSADMRKFTAAILGNLSSALTIKISGTIQKPKYKIIPVAVDVIKNLKDFFLGK